MSQSALGEMQEGRDFEIEEVRPIFIAPLIDRRIHQKLDTTTKSQSICKWR
jgi:hypothetical protein